MALTKVDAQLVSGAITTDTSGNVGIGTSSPNGYGTPNFHINGTTPLIHLTTPTTGTTSGDGTQIAVSGLDFQITNLEIGNLIFGTATAERMRLDTTGNLLVGGTTQRDNAKITNEFTTGNNGMAFYCVANTNAVDFALFRANAGALCGNISRVGTTNAVTYASASDYRLKENITPMTGALNAVAKLKPVTYTWKTDGSNGQGFIAHELAEVCPDAVVGKKDAINEDGSIKAQSIDTSFLVATLTAAIQELKEELDATKAEVQALKAKA